MRVIIAVTLLMASAGCSKTDDSRPASSLDAKMKCAGQGREWLARLEKEQAPYGVSVTGGQFAYDRKADTCLCYYRLSDHKGTITSAVTDVLTEKEVLNFMTRGAPASSPPTVIGVDKRAGAAPVRDLDDFDLRVRALGFEP